MTLDQRTLRALVRAMPKAELHLHLDGSLRIDTALEIARTREVDAPHTFAGMRDVLVAPDKVTDQAELLAAFDLPIALMQDADALERIAFDMVEDKAREHVRYAEVRWAPLLHTDKGLTGRQVVEAVWKGSASAARRSGIEVRLIATLMRSHPPERNLEFVRSLETGGVPDGLVAVDLAGPEARYPDPRAPPRGDRARAVDRASTSPSTPASGAARRRCCGRSSINPERIAHGPHAIEDPACVAALIERGVVLDLCPTSNTQANIVRVVRGVPAQAADGRRRAGDAQHRRPHGLRRHPQPGVRATRSRGSA